MPRPTPSRPVTSPIRPRTPPPDPDTIRPASREDLIPIAFAATLCAFIALLVCFSHAWLLLYGDAVAHLGIARRILDSRNPGLQQFGGVWLPLPHLVLLPFVQKMEWWQTGLAGAFPSIAFYILGTLGFFRLARHLLAPRWAIAATAFYALNPNLLYLATTAMTEPLFLAILLWLTVLTLEALAAIRRNAPPRLLPIALLILAAVFTRYDGWIVAAAVWLLLAWNLAHAPALLRRQMPAFTLFTLLTIAGPIAWLAFNAHFFHDPLDFIRGPYSAFQIDLRTRPHGSPHHRGWHDPLYSLFLYTRTAQIDSTAAEFGFLTMAAALVGGVLLCRRGPAPEPSSALTTHSPVLPPSARAALLLWLPLPFYVYSISWGSVPIFIPNLWPHAFYNTRYGLELLPALALFAALALAALESRLALSPAPRTSTRSDDLPLAPSRPAWQTAARPFAARLLQPITLALIAASTLAMLYKTPTVLAEAQHNSITRIPFEQALARELQAFQKGVPILMVQSDHVGALQTAGIPLRQTLSETDRDTFQAALAAPASQAAYIIAIAGDQVDAAVHQHPQNLDELLVLCTTGQPCARIYKSAVFHP